MSALKVAMIAAGVLLGGIGAATEVRRQTEIREHLRVLEAQRRRLLSTPPAKHWMGRRTIDGWPFWYLYLMVASPGIVLVAYGILGLTGVISH